MSDVNVKNLAWILVFLFILVIVSGVAVYFYSYDNSSIFTQINNPDLKE